ncbi:MAG: DUF501 domain-containing protein [Propionibacteriaceae bacterium]|jgi:hypothetical protein|nr:DUF501 domain-containing protein [Propionibacteriaceae bacterium]
MGEARVTRLAAADAAAVEAQLGRAPRGAVAVGWRCPCGRPGVVTTAPRLEDGTPFPTLYYLTCPRAVKLCSTLESEGAMAAFNARLAADRDFAQRYAAADAAYRADRAALAADLGLDDGPIRAVSAGGMPDRVKCLHALLAHSLAAGPGVNPVGDAVAAELGEWWTAPCAPLPEASEASDSEVTR